MRKALVCAVLMALLPLCMSGQKAFAPFPKAADDYWRTAVPQSMREDYIRLGQDCAPGPWTAIPDSVFAEFRTNGNRTHFETMSFAVRKRMACLVMAEIMEHKGRFMPAICSGLHYFAEQEPWWGLPAHYPKKRPEAGTQVVDLFNAETAGMLSWTLYMLSPEIERQEEGLSRKVLEEIERRFLRPTLEQRQGWKNNVNNWNTWITSNWLTAALICESDTARRSAAIKGACGTMRVFLDGYPDDGGCEEGVGYWDRAAASLYESLWLLGHAGEGEAFPLSSKQRTKVEAMGRFITTMHIRDLTFVNFSDAPPSNLPNINILFPYGRGIGDKPMMQMAAYVARRYDYVEHPSELFLRSGNYPTLGRELWLLSMIAELKATPAVQPTTDEAYLANSQILVAADSVWHLAVKGGNNNESHNHNDIGSFIVHYQGQPVLIDLGRDTYTSQTFSRRRYELTNNRSAFHNTPLIGGQEQRAGKQCAASNVEHESSRWCSALQMDLQQAYPAVEGLQRWTRRVALNRKRSRIEVSESLQGKADSSAIVLMCYGEPALKKRGRIALCGGKAALVYDARHLEPSWHKVPMGEGIMREQWHDNVYRLLLHVKGSPRRVEYRVEQGKANLVGAVLRTATH